MVDSAPHANRTCIGFPHAKINIGLQVRRKRQDGFHDLESLFVPIPWHDTLEIERLEKGATPGLVTHGLTIPGHPEDNLILRAHQLLDDACGIDPVRFHLVKSIPMGAGLGGGSSNGAHALRLLDRLFELHLSQEALSGMAAQLGSDCPFFIHDTPAHVTGRGENVTPLPLALRGWWLALIHPGVHISTPTAFGWVTPNDDRPSLQHWAGSSPNDWTEELHNDFTGPARQRHSEISEALNRIQTAGAAFADMSGSGSTVFGWFKNEPPDSLFEGCPEEWMTWKGPYSL